MIKDKNKEAEAMVNYARGTLERLIKEAYYTGWQDGREALIDVAEKMQKVQKEEENA